LCVEGKKLVLFVTGLCAQRCFYCPVSEHKYGKDVVYANEWKIENAKNPKELIEEVRLTRAKGAGITGGDPLVLVDRCCQYIRILKENFGRDFHVHLYTPLKLVTFERLQKLFDAGLDEIRFHPDLDDESLWRRLSLAREYSWDVGVEIPAIPGYEDKTKKLIDFIADKVKFINLNELELSDTQASHYKLHEMGFKQKDDISYGVVGSKEMALKMVEYAKSKGLSAHFCTAKLKDAIQLKNRIRARAENVALSFDELTEDGLLYRGCAYLAGFEPGIDFKARVAKSSASDVECLNDVFVKVKKLCADAVIDEKRFRVLLPPKTARKYAVELRELGLVPALVEEYPTADAIQVDIEFL
jgi:hypothetical protein